MIKQSFSSRGLIGFVPSSIGLLLALLVFLAFPSSSALATQCEEVYYEETGLTPNTIYVYLYCDTPGSTIFVKYSPSAPPSNPTHDIYGNGTNGTGAWQGGYFTVPYTTRLFIKALCYKAGLTDSAVTEHWVDNSGM